MTQSDAVANSIRWPVADGGHALGGCQRVSTPQIVDGGPLAGAGRAEQDDVVVFGEGPPDASAVI